MIISETWLREWVSTSLDVESIANHLTMAGLEVESCLPAGPKLSKVVVGEITEFEPHPHSDHLKICRVNVGKPRPLKIVCGAPNVVVGSKVPVALVGARLPNNVTVGKHLIRQILSAGMLCSAAELGIDDGNEGLWILDNDAVVGTPVVEHFDFNDHVIEIDLTPNRGDCLSIAGVAREVAALTDSTLTPTPFKTIKPTTNKKLSVRLRAPADCPKYVGRIIENVNVATPTPGWMRERLRRMGVRSIGIIVDITNYVMLELGQPMHAFDYDRIDGGIIVRRAEAGEKLELLDGKKVSLKTEVLVIADNSRPIALAGIMGGLKTAVNDSTRNILLEAAYFSAEAIAGKGRLYDLNTDASYRYERGVDFNLQERAMQRASELITKIAGGEPGLVTDARNNRYLPDTPTISLRAAQIPRLLGYSLPTHQVTTWLRRLNMKVVENQNSWRVSPPSYRFDISGEHDLIEELARLNGYNNLPTRAPRASSTAIVESEQIIAVNRLCDILIDRDYHQAITYSFVDQNFLRRVDPGRKYIKLANPIADNMAVMRTSLWPGLLFALNKNYNRQIRRIRLFETGHVFHSTPSGPDEIKRIAAVATGPRIAPQWGVSDSDNELDFFDIKADVEALLSVTGGQSGFRFEATQHDALHPGQGAELLQNNKCIGFIGRLHPDIEAFLDIEQSVFVFELDTQYLQAGVLPHFRQTSKFPSIRRDLAVVVAENVPAAAILEQVTNTSGSALKDLKLIDVYRGEHIDFGKKSVAFSLTLQETSRTLTVEEAKRIMIRVENALNQKLGAVLRA